MNPQRQWGSRWDDWAAGAHLLPQGPPEAASICPPPPNTILSWLSVKAGWPLPWLVLQRLSRAALFRGSLPPWLQSRAGSESVLLQPFWVPGLPGAGCRWTLVPGSAGEQPGSPGPAAAPGWHPAPGLFGSLQFAQLHLCPGLSRGPERVQCWAPRSACCAAWTCGSLRGGGGGKTSV